MREDRKVSFGAGLILFVMMVSVELIGWKRVTVRFTTHSVGHKITANDKIGRAHV